MILRERERLDDQQFFDVPLYLLNHSMGGQLVLSAVTQPENPSLFPPSTIDKVLGTIAIDP